MLLGIHLSTVPILGGRPPQEAWANFKVQYVPSFMASLAVWPPAQFINFTYVPHQYRVLWVNTIAFFWTIYLSIQGFNKTCHQVTHAQEDAHGQASTSGVSSQPL